MKHTALDIYDDMPEAMRKYISQNGWHFNKKACEYAVSRMWKKNPNNGLNEPLEAITKETAEELLKSYGIEPNKYIMYDGIYVMNMAKADYYKSSIPDEQHLCMFVKDTLEDVDGSDELPFRYWLQKCVALGEPVEFEDLL